MSGDTPRTHSCLATLVLDARALGAGMSITEFGDENDRPLCAVVVLDGQAGCEEVLPILREIQERWSA